jgi:hypothetical protein
MFYAIGFCIPLFVIAVVIVLGAWGMRSILAGALIVRGVDARHEAERRLARGRMR